MSLHAVLEWWEYKILLWENAQLDDGEIFDQSQGRIWIRRIILIKLSQKTRILNDVTNGPKKEYAKNTFIYS